MRHLLGRRDPATTPGSGRRRWSGPWAGRREETATSGWSMTSSGRPSAMMRPWLRATSRSARSVSRVMSWSMTTRVQPRVERRSCRRGRALRLPSGRFRSTARRGGGPGAGAPIEGSDLDHPAGSGGQLGDELVPEGVEAEELRWWRPGPGTGLGVDGGREVKCWPGARPSASVMAFVGDGNGVLDRERGPEAGVLERGRRPAQGAGVGGPAGDIGAEEARTVPASGRASPETRSRSCRLAGAVRADQTDDLAGPDGEVDVVGGDDPAVALGEPAGLEDLAVGR